MADQFENKQIDKRVVVRYVRRNVIDEKDYEKHLKSLPDLAEQAMPIESLMEGEPEVDGDEEA
jgi:hypothetical protein